MSIHINIVCDHGRRDEDTAFVCRTAIGVGFDSLTETFGDVVANLREIGWHVETDGHSRETRCLCPEHAPSELIRGHRDAERAALRGP